MAKRVLALEDAMRSALHARKQLHFVEESILLKAFRVADVTRSRRVDKRQFCAVWATLGVTVTHAEAAALFGRYGQDRASLLPYEVFTKALLLGRARLAGMAAEGVLRHAFAKPEDAAFHGKIIYPQCRKGVFPPTSWDPAHAVRSASDPDAQLDLEFVYGYNGLNNFSNNLWFSATGEVLYYAANVCIAYDRGRHSQRFMRDHDDDVLCLTVSADRLLAASGQVGLQPQVHVWETKTLRVVATLRHDRGSAGVVAVAFSPDTQRLLCVCSDDAHTVHVWDWRRGALLCSLASFKGTPSQVYGAMFHPSDPGCFLTWGNNHIKWWTRDSKPPLGGKYGEAWTGAVGSFALAGSPHPVTALVLLPSAPGAPGGRAVDVWVSGAPDGALMVWKGAKIVRIVRAHAKGVAGPRPELVGGTAPAGVRCLALLNGGTTLVSGGADGHLLFWNVGAGDLEAASLTHKLPLTGTYTDDLNRALPSVRGLDVLPAGLANTLVVGTDACDVWEIGDAPRLLVQGHTDDLYGVAWNPAAPSQFATACDSDRINVWDALTRKVVLSANIAFPARCCAYSPSGDHLAVGLVNGGIKVLDSRTLQQLVWAKNTDEEIACLAYSPDGRYLAVGSHDSFLDLYAVNKAYSKIRRCAGHAGNVMHIDWSADSTAVASDSSSYELLVFEASTGRQARQDQRDTVWATHTCILGFPVMGIWPSGADGTDVNAVDRSHTWQRHLVTADDLGQVKLFNYPVVAKHAPHRAYGGHSSHVMNVRFSPDDVFVASVGGKDRAVFQWRTHGVVPPRSRAGDPPVDRCILGSDCPVCAARPAPPRTPWAPLGESGVHWGQPGLLPPPPAAPPPQLQAPRGPPPQPGYAPGPLYQQPPPPLDADAARAAAVAMRQRR